MTRVRHPVHRPEGAAGAHRGRTAPAAGGGAGALPVHPRPRGGRTGDRAGARSAAPGTAWRSVPAPTRIQIAFMAEGIGPRRRGVPAGLHLHRDGRGAAGAGRHAGVRRCRSAHLPDRPGASRSAASPRCGATGRLRPRALIGVDLFGQPADWPALSAIAAARGPVHARRPARRASAAPCTAGRSARRRMPRRPASSRRSRWAPTATAARCSPKATNARRCIAACARTARARRATRCCTPG